MREPAGVFCPTAAATGMETNMQRETTSVIYHASCPDGFGAAWAAHRVLGERAQYLPMNHGDPIPQMDDDAKVYSWTSPLTGS